MPQIVQRVGKRLDIFELVVIGIARLGILFSAPGDQNARRVASPDIYNPDFLCIAICLRHGSEFYVVVAFLLTQQLLIFLRVQEPGAHHRRLVHPRHGGYHAEEDVDSLVHEGRLDFLLYLTEHPAHFALRRVAALGSAVYVPPVTPVYQEIPQAFARGPYADAAAVLLLIVVISLFFRKHAQYHSQVVEHLDHMPGVLLYQPPLQTPQLRGRIPPLGPVGYPVLARYRTVVDVYQSAVVLHAQAVGAARIINRKPHRAGVTVVHPVVVQVIFRREWFMVPLIPVVYAVAVLVPEGKYLVSRPDFGPRFVIGHYVSGVLEGLAVAEFLPQERRERCGRFYREFLGGAVIGVVKTRRDYHIPVNEVSPPRVETFLRGIVAQNLGGRVGQLFHLQSEVRLNLYRVRPGDVSRRSPQVCLHNLHARLGEHLRPHQVHLVGGYLLFRAGHRVEEYREHRHQDQHAQGEYQHGTALVPARAPHGPAAGLAPDGCLVPGFLVSLM